MTNKLVTLGLVVLILFFSACEKKSTEPKGDVAKPVITSSEVSPEGTVEVTIECETEGAEIRYTLDNSAPREGSTLYTVPLSIESTTTIKAIAYKDNWNPSEMAAARIVITRTVGDPVVEPDGGAYHLPVEVKITSPTEDAEIRYTLNNLEPNVYANLYSEPITIDRTLTLKTRAFKEGWTSSEIISTSFVMSLTELQLSPEPGYYNEKQMVSITLLETNQLEDERSEGVSIHCTLNGNTPDEKSPLYTEPLLIDSPTTIKAIALKDGWTSTKVITGFYDIDLPVVDNPIFEPAPGNFFTDIDVTISNPLPEAEIYYTLDGSEPTSSSLLYSQPINIPSTTTIKAKAFITDWLPSETITAVYNISEHEISMVSVPSGNFTMGDTQNIGESDELPTHSVTISAFKIGKHLVKQSEWILVMGENPSSFIGPDRPVENVSWYEAIKFCNKLSIMSKLQPVYNVYGDTNPDNWSETFEPVCNPDANGYRLPTEAEWEYAARGGVISPDYRYSGGDILTSVGWYVENSSNATRLVGRLDPNALNIYDMSGNVWEWCWDWYSGGYYSISPQDNPQGPSEGSIKVRRGGAWDSNAASCRISNRSGLFPTAIGNSVGFRIAQ